MIDYAKQKWAEVHTVRDFVSFTEDPNIDTLEFMKTLVDPAKSGFWIAANVDIDIDMDDILAQEPEISHDDITATTRTASEIEHHKKYKFSNKVILLYNGSILSTHLVKSLFQISIQPSSSSFHFLFRYPTTVIFFSNLVCGCNLASLCINCLEPFAI